MRRHSSFYVSFKRFFFQNHALLSFFRLTVSGLLICLYAPLLLLPSGLGASEMPGNDLNMTDKPEVRWSRAWPVLKVYEGPFLEKISMPVGGIGTGTVGLGGRGNLRDWEIMNRPAKGFIPYSGQQLGPFLAIYVRPEGGQPAARLIEGPLPDSAYEGSHGSTEINHGFPRFRYAAFAAAYPFAQVYLADPEMPVDVRMEAFNPLVPADSEASGWPIAVLRIVVINKIAARVKGSVCATLPNFIGEDGSRLAPDWKQDMSVRGPKKNKNEFKQEGDLKGIFMKSDGVNPQDEAWGTIALVSTEAKPFSYRTNWLQAGWGTPALDFWDDFSSDGKLEPRPPADLDMPYASLAVEFDVPALQETPVTFILAWHFPNRRTWTPGKVEAENIISNYYTTLRQDAWQTARDFLPHLTELEAKTCGFVRSFIESDFPPEVKEAALFNLSTLRTQTCFRTADGRFFGYEGSSNRSGCCWGSCTHVWNYEQATAFLFGSLARSIREVEFLFATNEEGLMSFRVGLPLDSRACQFNRAAADGQMGCIMKVYRDWKLSGDDAWLQKLWPKVKTALSFAWIKGGWDADRDGVMEGCQHNTMDVEYYGPNPQMQIWYLGALRAAALMAERVADKKFAVECRRLFENGSRWTDQNLFNGEYYIHLIRPPKSEADVAPVLLVGMGAKNLTEPDYQLGEGCLVDQLVGQYMAHISGLGYLIKPENARTTLRSIMKYNFKEGFYSHFNCLRSFVLGEERALLMASYPGVRPKNPFPYFTEVMTGFEYTAAVGMLYEGLAAGKDGQDLVEDGLRSIRNIRERYDGRKRNPFDEAECGHHYARAMASWASVLALTEFYWDGVNRVMEFSGCEGNYFWSNGTAWGTYSIKNSGYQNKEKGRPAYNVEVKVLHGSLGIKSLKVRGLGQVGFKSEKILQPGDTLKTVVIK